MADQYGIFQRFVAAQERAEFGPVVPAPLTKGVMGRLAAALGRAETKAGSAGAAAGEAFARSRFNASKMEAAAHAGGTEAAGRMRQRLTPRGGKFHDGAAFEAKRAQLHEKAVQDAYAAGHRDAANAHAGSYARTARAAAKIGFRAGSVGAAAGAAVGGAAAVAGAGKPLSEAQHNERKAAARARWAGHGAG